MIVKLGRLLIERGLLTKEDFEKAVQYQREHNTRLIPTLIQLKLINEKDLAEFFKDQFKIEYVDFVPSDIPLPFLELIPEDMARSGTMIPYKKDGNILYLAMANPVDYTTIDSVKFHTNLDVIPVLALYSKIVATLSRYRELSSQVATFDEIEIEDDDIEVVDEASYEEEIAQEEASSQPVVQLVNRIIVEAVRKGASDIHIEPFEKEFRLRYRVDGVLRKMSDLPMRYKAAVISRIKMMSELNIAERRLPQDGRIKMKVDKKVVDFRVSIIPVLFGEKVVMRILDKSALKLDMKQLGFSPESLEKFLDAINKPYGIVLVTGPTGSGKSTTLYSALSALNKPEVQIMTAEDPVEYNIDGINQVQVHPDIGFTFAEALRAFLRQSPNVILVGEIRDTETAEIAIRAALTGHLVLSTIHTNDAPSTVNRLVDMGIEPFLVAAALNLIQAQRLVRKVCQNCKEEVPITDEMAKMMKDAGVDPDFFDGHIYRGAGCDKCSGSGYKGRIALTEVMPISPEIRELILKGASNVEIAEQAKKDGMKTLRDDAMAKMKAGLTTLEEVLRETASM